LVVLVEQKLSTRLGAVDLATDLIPWNVTDYYREEMGPQLFRKFVSFGPLVQPSSLTEIKLWSQYLEAEHRWRDGNNEGRKVNLDPGYLEINKVVLASTKNASHRVYLTAGVYGEATLQFCKGSFQPFNHTYPDYRWPETLNFFHALRSRYLRQLRTARQSAG
jgi:hypothetical protein